MKLENPINFDIKKDYKKYSISYINLKEIVQGGPEVGNLMIDDILINTHYRFGGPMLFHLNSIYIPLFVKKFCKSGFILAKVNLKTHKIDFISTIKDIIFLDSIDEENHKIYYYEDLHEQKRNHIEL
ncbi:MAG: hypothetical protein AAF611_08045 [Bacteroidota bacterium]